MQANLLVFPLWPRTRCASVQLGPDACKALPCLLCYSAACMSKQRLNEIDEGVPEMILRLAVEHMQGCDRKVSVLVLGQPGTSQGALMQARSGL